MNEVEVKARLKNKEEVIRLLKDRGVSFNKAITQIDTVYSPVNEPVPTPRGSNVLRIREQDGVNIFTLKQPRENQLDCLEYETVFTDKDQMEKIILTLGFHPRTRVSKTRQKAKYNDLEICLDEVEELGSYIEVEKITSEEPLKVQEELMSFLLELGVSKEDQVFDGYDVLLLKKAGKIF